MEKIMRSISASKDLIQGGCSVSYCADCPSREQSTCMADGNKPRKYNLAILFLMGTKAPIGKNKLIAWE